VSALDDAATRPDARKAFAAMGDLVLDNERRREVSAALGLSFGRIRALRRIGRAPMTMGELASALGVDAPNVTQVVDELEALGLVERQPHPTDRRAKLVATTPRGAKAVVKANAILSRPPGGLARLSDDELTLLVELLEKATAP
jgi:DNA-binding MarR family transcriptional regulator